MTLKEAADLRASEMTREQLIAAMEAGPSCENQCFPCADCAHNLEPEHTPKQDPAA